MKSEFYNCDNMEFMAKFPDGHFELAIVDPPYGIGADKAQNAGGEKWGFKQYKQTDWDSSIPSKEYFAELKRVSKNQIIWGGNYMTEHLPPSMGWIVWDKEQRDFSLADGELAWTSFKKALRIFELSRGKALANNNEDGGRIHPTQKPVRLYEWLLANYAKEGDKILDTHVGSGSSRIACHNLKFDFFGCELDEDYFKQAEQRYQEHIRQEVLF
ncbi:MAG: site-specific DNA-methyltransferase [Rickettsiales bacterium]|nr:site-specific DNA-methyltransferase [Rickettsiales bacterium]